MALPLTDYSTNKQHAVPQNIMSVEFKLIGSMTVRQFVYAAIGVIGAYLLYASSVPGLFKWPLVVIVGLGGVGFAFLPIEDRGLDIWIRNFLFAISRPTLRIWKKEPLPPAFLLSDYATALKNEVVVVAPTNSRAKLMEYLGESKTVRPKNKLDLAEELFLEHLKFEAGPKTTTITTTTTGNVSNQQGRAIKIETEVRQPELYLPQKKQTTEPAVAIRPKTNLTDQVVDLKNLVEKIRHKSGQPRGVLFELPAPTATIKTTEEEVPPLMQAELKKLELETKAAEAASLAKKEEERKKQEQMAKEFAEMKQTISNQLSEIKGPGLVSPLPSTGSSPAPTKSPLAMGEKPKEVAETIKTEKDITLSELPNVVNGVVKDPTGKMLQGVVIIVKDEVGEPVRALKTNELGQFIISTPLPNGKYQVTASQPPKRFATMEIIADGRILPPLSFTSKETNIWRITKHLKLLLKII